MEMEETNDIYEETHVLDKSVVFKSLMVLDVWPIATSRAPWTSPKVALDKSTQKVNKNHSSLTLMYDLAQILKSSQRFAIAFCIVSAI